MYNLIVSNQVGGDDGSSLDVPERRFLEYTGTPISQQLSSLSVEAIRSLKSWPCLLMREGRGEEEAQLVEIQSIRRAGWDLVVGVSENLAPGALQNSYVWRLRGELGIEQFEFSRGHWAVKGEDLLGILRTGGLDIPWAIDSRFGSLPLPAPSRSDLLEARKAISGLSHTKLDDLLLEAGVSGLEAGRDRGSRRDRANEIFRFVFENPGAKTAEDALFSTFLVERVSQAPLPEGALDALFGVRTAEPAPVVNLPTLVDPNTGRTSRRVFVVHGRNDQAKSEVVGFLEELSLEPIVLHEQPSMGRHLLTKFIDEAELATFAVVLMTGDDVGGLPEGEMLPRARQNVILELGYFLSHLGQPRVCALVTPGLEPPSDFDGIVYVRMTPEGGWRTELERELRAAKMPVDRVGR